MKYAYNCNKLHAYVYEYKCLIPAEDAGIIPQKGAVIAILSIICRLNKEFVGFFLREFVNKCYAINRGLHKM